MRLRQPRGGGARLSAPAAEGRPDLVLIHGLGSAASYWDNLVPRLASDYRVTPVDLPGHGPGARRLRREDAVPEQLADQVVARLRQLGIDRPHLVGLSLGGWVALEAAALGFGATVLALAPAGLWAPGAHVPRERRVSAARRLLMPLRPLLPRLATVHAVQQAGLHLNVAHAEHVTSAQFLAAAEALFQAKGYAACDRAAVANRFERGALLDIPVTVAFGDRDRVLPPATSQDRSLLPEGTEWTVVPDCGHAISWDQPEECLQLVHATTARARV